MMQIAEKLMSFRFCFSQGEGTQKSNALDRNFCVSGGNILQTTSTQLTFQVVFGGKSTKSFHVPVISV